MKFYIVKYIWGSSLPLLVKMYLRLYGACLCGCT